MVPILKIVLQGINLSVEGTHHGNFPSLSVSLVEEILAHYLRLTKSCTRILMHGNGGAEKPPWAGRLLEEPSRIPPRGTELQYAPARPAKDFHDEPSTE